MDIVPNYSCLIEAEPACVREAVPRGLCAFEAEHSRRASSSCFASLTPPMASRSPPAWRRSSRASSAATTASASWFTCLSHLRHRNAMLHLYPADRHAFGYDTRILQEGFVSRIRHISDMDTARICIQSVLKILDAYSLRYVYRTRMDQIRYGL